MFADGIVERGFGSTWMRFDGREAISPVVFWDEDPRPLLGTVTLEIFGLGIDPVNRRLIDVEAFAMPAGPPRGFSMQPFMPTGAR